MIGSQKGRCGCDDALAGSLVCDEAENAENVIGYEVA